MWRNDSEQSRMVVVQFLEDLFHDGFAEEDRFRTNPEFVAIQMYGGHLAVIKIDDLTMAAHQCLLLLLEIFRIDAGCAGIFPFGHDVVNKISPKVVN